MFLCEVQLGYMGPYTGIASTGKLGQQHGMMRYKWSDAGAVNQDLKGVQMVSFKTR